MNILFFSRLFHPHIGGVEKHVLEISKELIKKGHNVTVVTERHLNDLPLCETVGKIKVIRIPGLKDNKNKKFKIWKWLWDNRSLIQGSYVIHCHDVFFWYFPFRFVYFTKKVFTTFHGYETKFPLSKKSILIRKISEKLSNGNICVGDYIKKWYGTKPDYVVYGGVDRVQGSGFRVQGSKKLKIVFVGRFSKDMGLNTYISALDKLKKNNFKFEFDAYGEGDLKKELSKIGRTHSVTSDIKSAMQNADIIFASSYLTILEALSFSRIVISIYENPLKEDYLKNSPFAHFILIAKDDKEIIQLTKSIKENAWKYETMIKNGYEWAKKNTWENCASIYLKLWEK